MPSYKVQQGSMHEAFLSSRVKIRIFGGGFGNGKTAALCADALIVAQGYPGANMCLARESFPKLNDTLRKEFFKWCPKDWIRRMPTKDDNTCYLHNGTVINFRYVQQRGKTSVDGSTTSNLLSATYDYVGVDQMEDPGIQEKDFYDLLGRLRGSTPYRGNDPTMPSSGPRLFVGTCNPTRNWVYRKLVRPYHYWQQRGKPHPDLLYDAENDKPSIELFEGSTYANKQNLPADFIKSLEDAYEGQQKDRFLLGKWGAYEGLVYPEFNTDVHEIAHDEVVKYLRACTQRRVKVYPLESYDFGSASPTCYLLSAVDEWGRVILIDGMHQVMPSVSQHAAAIKRIRNEWSWLFSDYSEILADPAIFKRHAVAGYKNVGDTVAGIFDDDFNVEMRPAQNDITQRISKVSSYLNEHNHIPALFSKKQKAPLLYVSSNLEFFMTEIQDYYWARNPQGDFKDTPIDRNDHAMDATKYLLSYLPEPADLSGPDPRTPPGYMVWHEVQEQRSSNFNQR